MGKAPGDPLYIPEGSEYFYLDKGLRCRREKCTFAESSVEYLGHTLSKEGISQDKKADAVFNMPPPTEVSSVKSFLGLVQFYGKFIPNLATLAEPLYHLRLLHTQEAKKSA